MSKYIELKESIQKRINALPIEFAFSDRQFAEAMNRLGLAVNDTDKVCAIGSIGGFCLRTDAEMILKTFADTDEEMKQALLDDDFCIDAIEYELGNHEFCITYDPEDTMGALGLTLKDERTRRLYKIARKRYLEKAFAEGWCE